MNMKADGLADRYLTALRTHLAPGRQASLAPADKLGHQAMRMGLETLDLVQIHELALVALMSPGHPSGNGAGTIKRAGRFFRQALTPLATADNAARQGSAQPKQRSKTPHPGAAKLTGARERLRRETVLRKAAEAALKKSQRHHGKLLAESRLMQEQLRHLSHQILLAQEEERKHISHELHDEISQILTGINVRLAALGIEATANTGDLKKKIVSTQRLVGKSVDAVHRFARELRPAMLDDLGLIPAFLAFMKELGKRTGLVIQFKAVTAAEIEKLGSLKRTVLYRVAQEALTNVAKHAQASLVKVSIQTQPGAICMEISDNGKSFDAKRTLGGRFCTRLGIVGMRERMEMVGGTFAIESAPGKGTTVRVQMPSRNGAKNRPGKHGGSRPNGSAVLG